MLVFADRQRPAGYTARARGQIGGHSGSFRRSILQRGLFSFGLKGTGEVHVSFVPHSRGLIWKMLIRRGVADSGIQQHKRARDVDPTYVWIPKLDVNSDASWIMQTDWWSGASPLISSLENPGVCGWRARPGRPCGLLPSTRAGVN
jgi:hypothetical protein